MADKRPELGRHCLERVTGIEPALSAWDPTDRGPLTALTCELEPECLRAAYQPAGSPTGDLAPGTCPSSLRLDKLHVVFQEAMDWTNSHLHQFRIGDVLYGMHFEDWPDEELHEAEFKLADVAHAGERFRYDYDFGDYWEHEVLVERSDTIRPVLKFAVCLRRGERLPARRLRWNRRLCRSPRSTGQPNPQGAQAVPAVGGRGLQPRGLRPRRHERRAPAHQLISSPGRSCLPIARYGTVWRKQTGTPRMRWAVREAERVAEPLPLRLGEHRQRCGKVGLVFGPPALGLIEQLDLRDEVGDAAGGDPWLPLSRRR